MVAKYGPNKINETSKDIQPIFVHNSPNKNNVSNMTTSQLLLKMSKKIRNKTFQITRVLRPVNRPLAGRPQGNVY